MEEQKIKDQLSFVPEWEDGLSQEKVAKFDNVIVGGMGGSGLTARLFFFLNQTFPVWLHDDYGLPAKKEGQTLYLAISYSGNTAETLSFANEALARDYPLVIITSGGALLSTAKERGLPHILVPTGFCPREAVIYMLHALFYVLKQEKLLEEMRGCSIDYQKVYEAGRLIGKEFANKIPLIYASRKNQALTYLWKIMLNETGKVPAFANYFPELTHNEMQGLIPKTAGLEAQRLKVLLLLDKRDDERIQREMKIFQNLASAQGVEVISSDLPLDKINKLVYVLVAASVAARIIAESHGVDASSTPFIELFKKSLK